VRLLRRLASTSPLRQRPFLLLFTGRTISMLGSTIAPVALAFAVVDLTGSPSDLGLVPRSELRAAGAVPRRRRCVGPTACLAIS
jgi:hypothetical protein